MSSLLVIKCHKCFYQSLKLTLFIYLNNFCNNIIKYLDTHIKDAHVQTLRILFWLSPIYKLSDCSFFVCDCRLYTYTLYIYYVTLLCILLGILLVMHLNISPILCYAYYLIMLFNYWHYMKSFLNCFDRYVWNIVTQSHCRNKCQACVLSTTCHVLTNWDDVYILMFDKHKY